MYERRRLSHEIPNNESIAVVACVHVSSSHDLNERIRQQDGGWPNEYLSVCRPVGDIVEHCEMYMMVLEKSDEAMMEAGT